MRDYIEYTGWQFIQRIVGIHDGQSFAEFVGRSLSSVQKWKREPATDENPSASGLEDPITLCDRIFDWCLLHCPQMAELLAERYKRKLEAFKGRYNLRPAPTKGELSDQIMQIFREDSEFHHAIATGKSVADLRKEFADVVVKAEAYFDMLEAQHADNRLRSVNGGTR